DGPGPDLAAVVYGAGGYVNAMTGCNYTTFHQLVPSGQWREVLAAQAAAIASPLFRPEDVGVESAVIKEEARSSESRPDSFVWRRLMETAFREHPCGRPIVGTEASIDAITPASLGGHMRAHYRGSNLTQVIVGDVSTADVVAFAHDQLGKLQAGERPEAALVSEPEQSQARAVALTGSIVQPYLSVAFRIPHALHEDMPVLDALAGVLGQGSSSRLSQTLQFSLGLVSDIGVSIAAFRDAGLLVVGSALATDDIDSVIASIFREIERLRRERVAADEMEKGLRRLEAGYVLEHETAESIGGTLGFFETLGDYRRADEYIDSLGAVTPDDIRRVAETYLTGERLSLVKYAPAGSGAAHGDESEKVAHLFEEAMSPRRPPSKDKSAGRHLREEPDRWTSHGFKRPMIVAERAQSRSTRETLPSGATLITCESNGLPLASIALAFRGGHVAEPADKAGITYITQRLLERGTGERTGRELAEAIEGLGSGLAIAVDRDGFGVGSTVLSRFYGDAFDILSEVLTRPAFDSEQLDLVRGEVESEIGAIEDDPRRRAALLLLPMIFSGHPYGRALRGTRESISGISISDVRDWHALSYSASNLVACVSGRVTQEAARDAIERLAESLPGGGDSPRTEGADCLATDRCEMASAGSRQSNIALGLKGAPAGSEDGLVLRFLARALGMMGGRLWVALRENPPHAYSVYASHLSFAAGGSFATFVTAQPGTEREAVESLTAVFKRVRESGLEADELARAQRHVAGMLEITMERESTRAARYAMAELLGIGYEGVEKAPELVRGITNADVVRVARRYLDPGLGLSVVTLRGKTGA
ncbi:insulinase family protein, partial [bacterium]|nr:insulinase family protein [bacterium]